ARIKKIMQMDEDVGKLASATPVMISKSLECFMQLMIDEAVKEARSRGSKKLTSHHLKHTINNTPSFDFLLDIASNISDP
ncbi:histone-fold-containing protein, partial [Dioszegia hungarica]